VLFRFANARKDPAEAEELASQPFLPSFAEFAQPQEFSISAFLGSTIPGRNFAIANGLGVAVVVEGNAPIRLAATESAFLRIHGVSLDFSPRPLDENVTV
jgi:hypothetical protein